MLHLPWLQHAVRCSRSRPGQTTRVACNRMLTSIRMLQKLTPQPEPKRQKVHWDHLLEEMKWLYTEFTK